jgi:hypothetical protein
VVSGTSSEGCGVFFKLKRSSQTSLEGVHDLAVTFIAPARWRGATLDVACGARGERKVLWMKQDATLGGERSRVRLFLASTPATRQVVLKPPAESEPIAANQETVERKSDAWRPATLQAASSKAAARDDSQNATGKSND